MERVEQRRRQDWCHEGTTESLYGPYGGGIVETRSTRNTDLTKRGSVDIPIERTKCKIECKVELLWMGLVGELTMLNK